MKSFGGSLLVRLTVANYFVAGFFLLIAGFTVYRISQDSIKMGAMGMVREMAEDLQLEIAMDRDVSELGDRIHLMKLQKTGSAWIMDSEGSMLFNPDPQFREEYIVKKKNFGNVMVSLQYASPRPAGTGKFKEKLIDIAGKYEEGFGEYSQFGVERILAFRAVPGRGLLIGVDEPKTSANSELERIKKYIFYTGLVSAVLIMAFSFLSMRVIIRPYYEHVEDLNVSLQHSNRQLEDINAKLAASNKNLTTLHEIGLAMQQSLTLKDILDIIISGAHEVLAIDRINLMLPSSDGRFLECRAAVGQGDTSIGDIRVPLGMEGGALSASFERKETIRFEEGVKVPRSHRLQDPYDKIEFLRSKVFVVVPLVVKDRAVGVIAVDNKTSRRPITDAQVSLMGIFANQAAVAVDNARLYDQLRNKIDELDARVDQLSILHQIGNSMQRVITRKEALGFIMRAIREGLGFTEVFLALLDRGEEVLQGEIGLGLEEETVQDLKIPLLETDNLLVMSAAGRRPVGIVHFSKNNFLEIVKAPLQKGEFKESLNKAMDEARIAAAAVPLIAREEVVGIVAVGRREPPLIKRHEIELLMLFANTAGLTVERAELYAKMHRDLESMEITDHVTGLFTYRYGQQRIKEEIAKGRETGSPLSVILMGIDNFKEYNDRCGPEAGDRSLGEIGDIVKGRMGGADFAYRYGGRLMVAVLPGADLKKSTEVAETIQEHVRRHRFRGPEGAADQVVTLSAATLENQPDGRVGSEADIFKLLLGLLHRAEAEGGDRVLTS